MKDEKYNLNIAYTKDGIVCGIEKSKDGSDGEDGVNEYIKGENKELEKLGPIGINGKKGKKGNNSFQHFLILSGNIAETIKVGNYFKIKSNYNKRGFRK